MESDNHLIYRLEGKIEHLEKEVVRLSTTVEKMALKLADQNQMITKFRYGISGIIILGGVIAWIVSLISDARHLIGR